MTAPEIDALPTLAGQVGRKWAVPQLLKANSINPLIGNTWDDVIKTHPESASFHSSAWAKVLHGSYGHIPHYYTYTYGSELAAVLPLMEVRSTITGRRGVCLPFTDACGPLYFNGHSCAAEIVNHVKELAEERNWKHFELRTSEGNTDARAVTFHRHTLDLTPVPEELLKACAGSVRRAIHKAEREGLTARASTDLMAVTEFYRLHALTRRRHGVPPQPFSFFRNIHEHLISRGKGFVVLVHAQAIPVAGAVFLHGQKNAVYKFGASDARHLELRGNNLAMWEGIQALKKAGVRTLDFGRTSCGNEGLNRFKRSWGACEQELRYSKFDVAEQKWVESRDQSTGMHNTLFRHLPLSLNRFSGAFLYPHLD